MLSKTGTANNADTYMLQNQIGFGHSATLQVLPRFIFVASSTFINFTVENKVHLVT